MRGTRRLIMAGVLAVLAFVTSAAVAVPARAEAALSVHWALVDTGNCRLIDGDLTVSAQPGGCRLNDGADGTVFKKDAGGRALKVELYIGSAMVGKAEFHPFGEQLWVYDTRNDDDTFYYEPVMCGGSCGDNVGYKAPGTGNRIDFDVIDFNLAEGSTVDIWVWDDAGLTRLVTAVGTGRA